jgi:hypothetical protein
MGKFTKQTIRALTESQRARQDSRSGGRPKQSGLGFISGTNYGRRNSFPGPDTDSILITQYGRQVGRTHADRVAAKLAGIDYDLELAKQLASFKRHIGGTKLDSRGHHTDPIAERFARFNQYLREHLPNRRIEGEYGWDEPKPTEQLSTHLRRTITFGTSSRDWAREFFFNPERFNLPFDSYQPRPFQPFVYSGPNEPGRYNEPGDFIGGCDPYNGESNVSIFRRRPGYFEAIRPDGYGYFADDEGGVRSSEGLTARLSQLPSNTERNIPTGDGIFAQFERYNDKFIYNPRDPKLVEFSYRCFNRWGTPYWQRFLPSLQQLRDGGGSYISQLTRRFTRHVYERRFKPTEPSRWIDLTPSEVVERYCSYLEYWKSQGLTFYQTRQG